MSTAVPSLLELKASTTPATFASLMREKGKVQWRELEGMWVVSDYACAEEVLKGSRFSADRSAFFGARMPHIPASAVGDFFGVVTKMMVNSDAPLHTARRKLGSMGLTDAALDAFAPNVRQTAAALVAAVAKRPSFDFVSEVAQELPSIVLADLFCVDEAERHEFYERANAMTQFFGAQPGCPMRMATAANSSAAGLRDFFARLIVERRQEPKSDFLSALLRSQEQTGLDDSEVIAQAIMMLVAGKVTTSDQIATVLHELLTNEGAFERIKNDPALLEAAIEEATRLDPAVTFVFRVAKEELELGGARIKAGEVVFVSVHAVNRDPAVFENPNELRLDRKRNPHLSYGQGAHYCLGAKLARIQMKALFAELLRAVPALRLDGAHPPVRKNQSLAFGGFESLHVRTQGHA